MSPAGYVLKKTNRKGSRAPPGVEAAAQPLQFPGLPEGVVEQYMEVMGSLRKGENEEEEEEEDAEFIQYLEKLCYVLKKTNRKGSRAPPGVEAAAQPLQFPGLPEGVVEQYMEVMGSLRKGENEEEEEEEDAEFIQYLEKLCEESKFITQLHFAGGASIAADSTATVSISSARIGPTGGATITEASIAADNMAACGLNDTSVPGQGSD
ncbi:UNVERIFIED_CONTAM: hypothetical protein FKN15_063001 [Acipenser sinensis]